MSARILLCATFASSTLFTSHLATADKELASFDRLKDKADAGNVGAAQKVGMNLFFGTNGVQKDEKIGLRYILLAAEKGDMESQEFMMKIYATGHDILKKSLKESIRWGEMAANSGSVIAPEVLGNIYKDAAKDLSFIADDKRKLEQYRWFKKAASAHGSLYGLVELADCYREGTGTPQDYKKAIELYEQVAAEFNAVVLNAAETSAGVLKNKTAVGKALNNLGALSAQGLGMEKDVFGAITYFEQSHTLGYEEAAVNLKNMKEYEEKRRSRKAAKSAQTKREL